MGIVWIQLKDGLANLFDTGLFDVGTIDQRLLPTSVPHDQFGSPLFTATSPGNVVENIAIVTASFARPANTTQYSSGDLIANDTSNLNFQPLAFPISRANGNTVSVRRAHLIKSGVTVTAAKFRAHIYGTWPIPDNGDNGVWLTNKALNYAGSYSFDMTGTDVRVFNDGLQLTALPDIGTELVVQTTTATAIYAALEARDVYTPGNQETFSLTLEYCQH